MNSTCISDMLCPLVGWAWTDKTSLGFLNWAQGEPNSAFHPGDIAEENCVEMYLDGRWNDNNCLQKRGFACRHRQCKAFLVPFLWIFDPKLRKCFVTLCLTWMLWCQHFLCELLFQITQQMRTKILFSPLTAQVEVSNKTLWLSKCWELMMY